MRYAAVTVIVATLAVGLFFLAAAKESPYYQEPHAQTVILWDSTTDAPASVPRPDHPSVRDFVSRFPNKLTTLDLARTQTVNLEPFDAILVHPSSMNRLNDTIVPLLKSSLSRGKAIVWMSSDVEPFLVRLGINYFGFKSLPESITTVVGVGVKDEGGLLPRYMVISVPSDALAAEGPRVALNGLINGSTELLTTRTNPYSSFASGKFNESAYNFSTIFAVFSISLTDSFELNLESISTNEQNSSAFS